MAFGKPHCYVTVCDLPELVCMRIPLKLPQRVLYPALTKLAKAYGCKQRDISYLSNEAQWDGKVASGDYELFSAAFRGAYRLPSFELWEWDSDENSLALVRSCLLNKQARYAEKASKWQEQTAVDLRLPRWSWSRFTRIKNFDLEDCVQFYEAMAREGSIGPETRNSSRDVIAVERNGRMLILDGKDRVADALRSGHDCVCALIGDLSSTAEADYAERVAKIDLLKKRAGAAFSFWEHATDALAKAKNDPRGVNWIAVDEAVLFDSIVKNHQPQDVVATALIEMSPSAAFPDREEQLVVRAEQVARLAAMSVPEPVGPSCE